MKRLFCAVLVLMLCVLPPVQATSPCVPQTAEEFAETKDASDLIVHVRITDYFAAWQKPDHPKSSTRADVLKVYKGDPAIDKVIVMGWVSYYLPLYTYEKGSEAVLLLKKHEGHNRWILTDMSWKSCVPAVIGIPADMTAAQKEAFIRERLGGID